MAFFNGQKILNARVEMVGGGYEEGYTDGYNDGVPVGFSSGQSIGRMEGRNAEREEWWTKFQDNGDATNYTYAFWGSKWTDDIYHPVRGFKVLGGNQMFCQTKITDTKVPIDISASTTNHVSLFNWSRAIVTINKLIVAAHNSFSGDFEGCSNLENITFEGVIGNNIDFSACTKLTAASVYSIVDHLKQYLADDAEFGTKKVTFSQTAWNNFVQNGETPEGMLMNHGSWENYLTNIGWQLVLA